MRTARLNLFFSIVALIAVGTLGVTGLAAHELNVQNNLPTETQLAQTAEAPKAKSTLLFEQKLESFPGFMVQIVLVEGPPGWVGGRHYHPGYLFGYVFEGSLVGNFEDPTPQTLQAGEVFYESPNTVKRSGNGSSTEPEKNIVFQILREGQPGAISVK